jgi:hypothetical protein
MVATTASHAVEHGEDHKLLIRRFDPQTSQSDNLPRLDTFVVSRPDQAPGAIGAPNETGASGQRLDP